MTYISYLFQSPPQRKDAANFADEELHSQAKSKAKQKFKIFPSAYASSYIVQEYKRLYKQKNGSDSKAFTSKDDRTDNLREWHSEKWKAINSSGKIVGECGSGETKGKVKCLPEKKAESLSEEDRAKLAKRKQRKDPKSSSSGTPVMVSSKLDEKTPVTPEQKQYACDLINRGVRFDAAAKCKFGKPCKGRCIPKDHECLPDGTGRRGLPGGNEYETYSEEEGYQHEMTPEGREKMKKQIRKGNLKALGGTAVLAASLGVLAAASAESKKKVAGQNAKK